MEEIQKKPKIDRFIDSAIDFLFEKNAKWLLFIFLLGVVLRFIIVRNISVLGDEMVHGPHAIGFLHSGLISTFAHSPLWFYLTDIAMKIFGVTIFSTRFLSFFYGSLSILVVYMIARRIFNNKIALISSFLLSVSFYTIRYTLMEMDLSAIFFMLMAMYFFIVSAENKKFPVLAAVCIGLAALIKTLSLFFVPAFLIGFFILNKEEKKLINLKKAVLFGFIIVLVFSPILIHNYLWYKDKQMVDTYVAQYFDIGNAREAYKGLMGYDSGFLLSRFFEGIFSMSGTIFNLDPLIVIFGILGMILTFFIKEKRNYFILLLSFQISGFVFLILSNWLPTHYTTMIPVLCVFGGVFIDKLAGKINVLGYKKTLAVICLIILSIQVYLLLPHLTSRCALSQTRDYVMDNFEKDAIVLADARIYRGRIAWLLNDYHYLEASLLYDALELNKNISGQDVQTKLYFIECARDDCGWGTIKDQPELNQSMENLVGSFSNVSSKTIFGGGGYDEETGKPYFRIYEASINLKPAMISVIDSTHDWFYYPVNYVPKEKIFDNYEVKGFFDNLIYKFAWLITIFSIISAILMAPYSLKLLLDKHQ